MRLALASSLFKVTGFHETSPISGFQLEIQGIFMLQKSKMLMYAEKITHADDNLR